MKVILDKTFAMPASVEVVWALLRNFEAVAGCMPGARITGQLDPRRYQGTVAVRLGPASLTFKGEIEIRELDETQRTLRLIGKGGDSSGTSGASMDLTVRAEAGETREVSRLVGKSELSMSGKAASFGGRMMGSVADQLLKQFVENFAREVRAVRVEPGEMAAGSHAQMAGTNNELDSRDSALGTAQPVQDDGASHARSTLEASSPGSLGGDGGQSLHSPSLDTAQPDHSPAAPRELNALALVWAALRDWVRNVLRRKPA